MKRLLSLVLSGAIFASVIAGALSLSMLRLLQSKSAPSGGAAPSQALVSAGSTTAPTMAGTDHPVPVNPSPEVTAAPKQQTPIPPATPAPQISAVAENDSRSETESPVELVREKAEQARENAERLRAHVEDLYQAHRISEAAYKQGQAEYHHELAKYEDQIAKLHTTMTGTGAANE
jgi:type IV secretory pathway VirB10-like protein